MTDFVHTGKFIPDAPDKDPNSSIDYGEDWSDTTYGPWLETGETISSSTWIVPAGLTGGTESNSTTQTSIFLSGGTEGETYTITNRITTSASRTEDRSMKILCKAK